MKSIASLFLVFTFIANGVAQSIGVTSLSQVVAAENAFADSAAKNGTRAAFLEFSAENGIVFSETADNVKEVWQKRQPNAALLSWRPAWADVSSVGDLGYTTGTWAFSRTKTDAPVAWGEYFTIWKKQHDDSWKFLIDLGIGHDKAEVRPGEWKSPESPNKRISKKSSVAIWNELENSFAESLRKKGAKKTYGKLASEQIRLLREGQMPFQGRSKALAEITDSQVKIKILGGGSSSDLAYAYGEYELKTPDGKTEKGFYARVWKLGPSGWRIAVEVEHPVPELRK